MQKMKTNLIVQMLRDIAANVQKNNEMHVLSDRFQLYVEPADATFFYCPVGFDLL
jgi:hypothetical protein